MTIDELHEHYILAYCVSNGDINSSGIDYRDAPDVIKRVAQIGTAHAESRAKPLNSLELKQLIEIIN